MDYVIIGAVTTVVAVVLICVAGIAYKLTRMVVLLQAIEEHFCATEEHLYDIQERMELLRMELLQRRISCKEP